MSKRIAYNTVVWSVAIFGTLWIATGLAIDLWSELRPRPRPKPKPIRFHVSRRQVA